MSRSERRQKKREEKKKQKISGNSSLLPIKCQEYSNSMRNFYKQGKGNVLDWLESLGHEKLRDLQPEDSDTENLESNQKDSIVLYLALVANGLNLRKDTTKEFSFSCSDEEICKMTNVFIHYVYLASLKSKGLIEANLTSDSFFEFEEGGFFVKLKAREEIPSEFLGLYDFCNQLALERQTND